MMGADERHLRPGDRITLPDGREGEVKSGMVPRFSTADPYEYVVEVGGLVEVVEVGS